MRVNILNYHNLIMVFSSGVGGILNPLHERLEKHNNLFIFSISSNNIITITIMLSLMITIIICNNIILSQSLRLLIIYVKGPV